MPLTDSQCRAPNTTGKREKRADGGGLRLVVTPTGRRTWELAFYREGKAATMSLGPYPTVSLAAARLAREKAKLDLQAGRDPAAPEAAPERPPCLTLREAAEAWVAKAGATWKPSHRERVESRLRMNVFPTLGAKRLDDIEAPDVLAAVREVEARGAMDISRRTVQAVAAIYRFAIASGWVKGNPAADLRGALAARPRVKHHAMVAPKAMGAFMVKLVAYDGEELTRLLVEATIRTALRSTEARLAVWSEVEGDLLRIPGDRMKVEGIEHLVPLAPQVRAILDRARELGNGSPYIFAADDGKPLSANTGIFSLYRMGFHSRATLHGFRRTFSTWANESGIAHPDAIERQLAHWPRDEIRGAYNAAEYLPARVDLMAAWNDWLDAERDLAALL